MIKITHKQSANGGTITISGHAGYAEHGKDIVCASISVLVQTFLVSVEKLTSTQLNSEIRAGNAFIEYGILTERAQVLLESFFIGVEGVQLAFPDFVQIDQA